VAGNRSTYEEAQRNGSALTQERRWEEAIASYERALGEFPDDPDALSGLGWALAGAGRFESALQPLRRAMELEKANPAFAERLGEVLERMGHGAEAARAYLMAAQRHAGQRAPSLAEKRWVDAARLDPQNIPARVSLLRHYLSQRKTQQALVRYVELATIYQGQGKTQQALEICDHALKLDPDHPEIRDMAERLRAGVVAPVTEDETASLTFSFDEEQESEEKGSPVEAARQKALADLAEAVFGETPPQTGPLVMRPLSKREMDALISKALDCQTTGDIEGAITCYEQVVKGGVIEPAVHFNLGLLYQEQLRFEDAAEQFQRSVTDPEYRMGSLFALGECQRALGQIDEALTHFIEVLKIVDLGTVKREQADDLIQLYEELARTHAAKGEREQAADFVNALISFLGEKGWEDKVVKARELLDALAREGPVLSLAEILAVPGSGRILQSIGLAQEYQRRDMKYAALDELSQAISIAPNFLPLHRQMGETLVSMGRVDDAVAKFLVVADVYQVRGSFSQAVATYERGLRLAPMNVAVRARLIDLLVSHGEIDRALEHYLALGDTYYQMAQLDRAREKYEEALQLAPRGSPERGWKVRFLHRIGDIDLQRVSWRQAMAVYEKIRNQAPDDEKARLTLMDLYYRFNQPEKAIAELDALLRLYRQTGKMQKVIAILQEQVEERPDDIPLRTRLAQAHLDAENIQDALDALDVLGEMQLQAGRNEDAIVTIRAILRLHPPNADAYQQLLDQLTRRQADG